MLKFIVTGTGRCGTSFYAKAISELGLLCGHESVFNTANFNLILERFNKTTSPTISDCIYDINWIENSFDIVGDSSYMAAPYLDKFDVKIIHLVRNPLSVISSFVLDMCYFMDKPNNPFNKNKWEQWIYSQIPLRHYAKGIERAAMYYILWNEMIEEKSKGKEYLLHKLEDGIIPEMCNFLNIPYKEIEDKKINSFKKANRPDIEFGHIRNNEIKEKLKNIMIKYEYSKFIPQPFL